MGLTYVVDRSEDARCVHFCGEIDIRAAGEAVNVIAETVLDGSPKQMVIDLNQVSLLDSTGIAALVTAHKIATHRGCQLVVTNPRAMVREALAVTGVLETLTSGDAIRPEGHA